MAKVFDATLKVLYEVSPVDLPRLCGYDAEQTAPIDTDTSIVSGAADKAIRVVGDPDWIMHVEFQSGPDASLPGRMDLDSLILEDRTGCQVRSAVILLRPKANLTAVNGTREYRFPNAPEPYRLFRYQVIRLWEIPVERLLAGGASSVALAPLGQVERRHLPDVIMAMRERYKTVASPHIINRLWTSTEILMGLTFEEAEIERLLREVKGMEDSVTYQAIKRKGAVEEGQRVIRMLGEVRFGPIPLPLAQRLAVMANVSQLEKMITKTLSAQRWEDIFDESPGE